MQQVGGVAGRQQEAFAGFVVGAGQKAARAVFWAIGMGKDARRFGEGDEACGVMIEDHHAGTEGEGIQRQGHAAKRRGCAACQMKAVRPG